MSWFKKLIFGSSVPETEAVTTEVLTVSESVSEVPDARYTGYESYAISFDGEKNVGDMGPVKRYLIDHDALRLRGWQMYIDSEVCQLVIRRFSRWVIGKGLSVQAEPNSVVLGLEGIKVPDTFVEGVEALFSVYTESKHIDVAERYSLPKLAKVAFENAITAGDVLVVLRVVNGMVKVQLIDGAQVGTPIGNCDFNGTDYLFKATSNRIVYGVELDQYGKHVAYHVRIGLKEYKRIAARDTDGRLMAYMPTGLGYRIGGVRGIPLVTAVMETASKLERYKEATLGSAEEAAKMVLAAEHEVYSTGENPLGALSSARGGKKTDADDYEKYSGVLRSQVAETNMKQFINNPPGTSLKAVESKKEIHFDQFYQANLQVICAVVGIPPEVALMKYDSNFSASRAALKDWEHSLLCEREDFAIEFYKPIYHLLFDLFIFSHKVQAPGYIDAVMKKNIMVQEAWRKVTFLGANVPHIDPLKEVNAERAKLGFGSEHIPLTTIEKATRTLNGGDYFENLKNYAKELSESDTEGIPKVRKLGLTDTNNDTE